MRICYLQYSTICLRLESSAELCQQLVRELSPFVNFEEKQSAPCIATISVFLEDLPPHLKPLTCVQGKRIAIDTSLYTHLRTEGWRWEVTGSKARLIKLDLTGTFVFIDIQNRVVEVFQPKSEFLFRDTNRVIKTLFTLAVEERGGLQLHASSAVDREGRAILVLGDMWQGKTTLLLELLSKFNVDQLTCDTTVIMPSSNGTPMQICGWPSPFSVSHGAVADHKELVDFFPQERRGLPYLNLWAEGKKVVLTSEEVTKRFNAKIVPHTDKISVTLIASFQPMGPIGVEPILDIQDVISELWKVSLGSRDPIYHNWTEYFVVSEEMIARNIATVAKLLLSSAPVFRFRWAPSAESLLKGIPGITKAHKIWSCIA